MGRNKQVGFDGISTLTTTLDWFSMYMLIQFFFEPCHYAIELKKNVHFVFQFEAE